MNTMCMSCQIIPHYVIFEILKPACKKEIMENVIVLAYFGKYIMFFNSFQKVVNPGVHKCSSNRYLIKDILAKELNFRPL